MSCYNEFYRWCTNTLPGLYDESISYYEVVCKLTNYVKTLYKDVEQLATTVTDNKNEIEKINVLLADINRMIEVLKMKQEQYENGEFTEVYVKAVYQWIKDNIQLIVDEIANVVHFVQFRLSANGYFQVVIPTNWDFLHFDTNMIAKCPCWGHLIMSY